MTHGPLFDDEVLLFELPSNGPLLSVLEGSKDCGKVMITMDGAS